LLWEWRRSWFNELANIVLALAALLNSGEASSTVTIKLLYAKPEIMPPPEVIKEGGKQTIKQLRRQETLKPLSVSSLIS
jgi:hypothetical protein